jgi:GxxExxY protein
MRVHSELVPDSSNIPTRPACGTNLLKLGSDSSAHAVLPMVYRGVKLDLGYRMDLLAEDLLVELKSVDALAPLHQAQVLSYPKLSGRSIGLLINFNVAHRKDGIKTPHKRHWVEVKE